MFKRSNFVGNNILLIGPKKSGNTNFISKIKDYDAVVIENVEGLSNNEFKDAIKEAGYRQIIVELEECKTPNVHLFNYDYLIVFNNKNMEWRDDVYYNFSMQKACADFNEFNEILDKLEEHECIVVSADERTIRRFASV